ncbi:MAG: hypothetical protein IMY67_07845 [Bacteroidetes bacterium]|nr:hypothetical protein [Bacteroidota bacterium]
MEFNIVFGTRKVARSASFQKHENQAVITIEGQKESGKSRRMLFNKTAMDVLTLTEGVTQEVLFGFVEQDAEGNRHLLIANVTGYNNMADEVTYTTSKNRIIYDGSKEKGKGVASKVLMKEINNFLEVEVDVEHEYSIQAFAPAGMPDTGLNLFELIKLGTDKTVNGNDEMFHPVQNDSVEEFNSEEVSYNLPKEVEPITMQEPAIAPGIQNNEEF